MSQVEFLKKRIVVVLGWIISMLVCGLVMFSATIQYQNWYEYQPVDSAFYNGFGHVGWAMGVSWLILACSQGHGGPVDKILSWHGWLPLSRLSYAAYLVQFIWLKIYTGSMRTPFYFSSSGSLLHFLGDIAPVMVLAAYLYITVEAPAMKLLRRNLR
jgi:peptidoglycan/LPS O-acetylase OafA/YrhL